MKALSLIHRDGTRRACKLVADDFDTQTWADERRESLQFLGVVRVEEEPLEAALKATTPGDGCE